MIRHEEESRFRPGSRVRQPAPCDKWKKSMLSFQKARSSLVIFPPRCPPSRRRGSSLGSSARNKSVIICKRTLEVNLSPSLPKAPERKARQPAQQSHGTLACAGVRRWVSQYGLELCAGHGSSSFVVRGRLLGALAWMRWHAGNAWALRVWTALLHVGLVVQRGLVGRHAVGSLLGHSTLDLAGHGRMHAGLHLVVVVLLLDRVVAVNVVAATLLGLGRVQAGLFTMCKLRVFACFAVCSIAARETMTYLDEILAFGLGDERLELGCGEGVHETGFGDDEQQDLSAREDGELVCLERREVS